MRRREAAVVVSFRFNREEGAVTYNIHQLGKRSSRETKLIDNRRQRISDTEPSNSVTNPIDGKGVGSRV